MALLEMLKRFETVEDLVETNDDMTTVSKAIPLSPCSDCSGPSMARSDWFRQSVLFWSSQSGRSDECTNDRYCKCHTNESSASSQTSLLSNLSPRSESCCKSSKVRSRKGAGTALADNDKDEKIRQPPKAIKYDPSDLLKQVEELERCFEKKPSDRSNDNDSPHLTLKFPRGSSIKKSPLYGNQKARTESNTVVDDDGDDDVSDADNIIETIRNVQNTLKEISKEIVQSSEEEFINNVDVNKTGKDKNSPTAETKELLVPKITKADGERDPNKVMMSLLSNIKPPPPTPVAENGDIAGDIGNVDNTTKMHDNHMVDTEELLLKIDELMQFKGTNQTSSSKNEDDERLKKYRDRLDSGLQSTSSDSNSPTHSPGVTRALGPTSITCTSVIKPERRYSYTNSFNRTQHVIREVTNEKSDCVFRDDSDFSDCSPVSTLIPGAHHRPRSHSASYSQNTRLCAGREFKRTSNGNLTDTDLVEVKKLKSTTSELERLHDKHEAETVKKFLALSKHHKDNESTLESICLDDIALIPTIKDAVEEHRKELTDQRKKQEDFLHQLGDLLLEVVTLKEEHTTVRTKQTKALNILKKQLDAHKKNQSQAHNDVINKVNSLDEKINFSISSSSSEQLVLPPSFTKGLTSFGSPDPTKFVPQRGHIIWKVSDIMKKLTKVKTGNLDGTLVSPTFLTSEYGYKMNAWLYLNGRSKTAGRYLSLYVCVLVGDYDAILHWPIRPSYTLTLIDQQGDSTRRQDYVKVRRVVDIAGRGGNVIAQSRGIPRPSDSTKALIVGFDDFISHEELLNRRYLVDDTLFLKIEAEVGML